MWFPKKSLAGSRLKAALLLSALITVSSSLSLAAAKGNDPDINHLPFDSDGWTVFPKDYATTIYVDSSGSDTLSDGKTPNPGTNPNQPIQSLELASSLIVNRVKGHSMRVMLKRGSQWQSHTLSVQLGGDDPSHPLLVDGWDYGSLSDPRPIVGQFHVNNLSKKYYKGPINSVAVVGLYVGPGSGIPETNGIEWSGQGSDFLIEDCVVDGFWQNIIVGGSAAGPLENFRMRRTQTINAYDANYAVDAESKPQGLYGEAINGALIEESLFDHNAYHRDDLSDNTEYGHDVYLCNSNVGCYCHDIRVRGNLISRSGILPFKGPADGSLDNNLITGAAGESYIGAYSSKIQNNVVIDTSLFESTNLSGDAGLAVDSMGDASPGALTSVNNNLFSRLGGFAFKISRQPDTIQFVQNIFYGIRTAIRFYVTPNHLLMSKNEFQGLPSEANNPFSALFGAQDFYKGLVLNTNQKFSGNQYYGPGGDGALYWNGLNYSDFAAKTKESGSSYTQEKYLDPNRSIPDYLGSLKDYKSSSKLLPDFVAQVKNQSKAYWRQEYRTPVVNNYLRAGYNMAAVPVEASSSSTSGSSSGSTSGSSSGSTAGSTSGSKTGSTSGSSSGSTSGSTSGSSSGSTSGSTTGSSSGSTSGSTSGSSGSHYFSPRLAPGYCASVTGEQMATQSPIALAICEAGDYQQFTFQNDGELTVFSGAMCVENLGGAVLINPCTGSSQQKWSYNSSSLTLVGPGGLCATIDGFYATGSLLHLESCTGASNQMWQETTAN